MANPFDSLKNLYRPASLTGLTGACGVSSLTSVFDHLNVPHTPDQTASYAKYDAYGTPHEGFAPTTIAHGLDVSTHEGLTLPQLDALLTPHSLAIINFLSPYENMTWSPETCGHYAVYLGHDSGAVWFLCNEFGRRPIPKPLFENNLWLDIERNGRLTSGWAAIISSQKS